MAILKANYVKRGVGERERAKASLRYITHRRDGSGNTVTRALFGFDGQMTKTQAYEMIDAAARRTLYYRMVVSPDPTREDRLKDLDLADVTLETMLALEARLGKRIQFVAAIHNDHSPHRHVHTLVLIRGKRLTRQDFKVLRLTATGRALSQRRIRDRARWPALARGPRHYSQSIYTAPVRPQSYFSRGSRSLYQSYTCPLCGYHQAFQFSSAGYRCPLDGLYLRRDRALGRYPSHRREVGLHLSL